MNINVWFFFYATDENITLTECDGSIQAERRIFVDFYKINRPCRCIVTSSFDGELVVSRSDKKHKCNTVIVVKVNNTVISDCYETAYARFNVQTNDTIIIKAEYVANYSSGGFSQCLEIYSEGKYIDLINH